MLPITMRITHLEAYSVPIAGAKPTFAWRQGLRGATPDGEGAVLRIATDSGAEGVALAPRRGAGRIPGTSLTGSSAMSCSVRTRSRASGCGIACGSSPHRRAASLGPRPGRHRAVGPGRPHRGPADLAAPWRLSAVDPGLRVDRDVATLEEYLDVITQCLELGYPAIKLHAWGDVRADAQLCLAVREHVGPVALMYDGSAAFDLLDAVYLGHALADAGYLWYEEPIREFSVTAYKWLGDRVRLPLCVAETSDGVTSIPPTSS